MDLSEAKMLSETNPERYGLIPKNFSASYSVAEHVMGDNASSYISTSSAFPEGSPRFEGKTIIVDIEKAVMSGDKLISTEEILKSLDDYKSQNPHLAKRIDKISKYVKDIDKVLLHGENTRIRGFHSRDIKIHKVLYTCRSCRTGDRNCLYSL